MSELFRDLDPQVAGPLEKITEALRAEISTQIDSVRQDVQDLRSGAASASAGSSLDALDELKHAATAIDHAHDQGAILAALLEGAGRFASRAAFILIRDDGHRCWGSLGFDGSSRSMQGESVQTNGAGAWSRVQDGTGTHGLSSEECAAFCSQFEAPTPAVGALMPLSLGDHVAGYLYADQTEGGSLNLSALQMLTFVAGQTLETLPVRGRQSTPTLIVAAAVEAAPVAEPVVEAPVPVAAPPEVEVEEPVSEPVVTEEPEHQASVPEVEPVDLDVEAVVEAPELEPALEETAADSFTAPVPLSGYPSAEAPTEVEAEVEVEASAVEETLPPVAAQPEAAGAASPSTQVVPPSDVAGPGWAFTTKENQTDAGNEALHEEARRLARLLVTEIKLYNEEQVDQGRRSGDIYRRLQEDIDRSRQIFEDRIDPAIRADNDYFKDALIRILAGGDESLLGM